MDSGTIKKSLLSGAVEGLVIEVLTHMKGVAVTAGADYLKGKAGGRGVNDEALFQSACAYAVDPGGPFKVSATDLLKVLGVINGLANHERRRVIEIIGKDEQDVKTKTPKLDAAGNPSITKKGDPIYEERTVRANVRGAAVIALMAKMTEAEMMEFLKSSNALDTVENKIKNIMATPQVQTAKQGLSDFSDDAKSFLKKKTSLVDFAERLSGKTIHK